MKSKDIQQKMDTRARTKSCAKQESVIPRLTYAIAICSALISEICWPQQAAAVCADVDRSGHKCALVDNYTSESRSSDGGMNYVLNFTQICEGSFTVFAITNEGNELTNGFGSDGHSTINCVSTSNPPCSGFRSTGFKCLGDDGGGRRYDAQKPATPTSKTGSVPPKSQPTATQPSSTNTNSACATFNFKGCMQGCDQKVGMTNPNYSNCTAYCTGGQRDCAAGKTPQENPYLRKAGRENSADQELARLLALIDQASHAVDACIAKMVGFRNSCSARYGFVTPGYYKCFAPYQNLCTQENQQWKNAVDIADAYEKAQKRKE